MNIYVYEEYDNEDVFDERTVKAFLNKSNAVAELRKSVENFFDEDWDVIGDEEIGEDDTFEPDHVSYSSDGDTTHYWEIKTVYTSESRYCTEDDISAEIDALVDISPEYRNIPESAYADLAKKTADFIAASDTPSNLSDLMDEAIDEYMSHHPELDFDPDEEDEDEDEESDD